ITSITFAYAGGGCAAGQNGQGTAATCTATGTLSTPVALSSAKPVVSVFGNVVGSQVKFSPTSGATVAVKITSGSGSETDQLKIDCSQPILPGNRFGSLQ